MTSDKETCDDILLASEWGICRVEAVLEQYNKSDLLSFLHDRHYERFFKPIELLKNESGETYGFAIMALCSLLIETLQCYREGWPSTNQRELTRWRDKGQTLGADYRLDDLPDDLGKLGEKVFKDFFGLYPMLFPGIDGVGFYKNVRNGLLHQAQTKGGWRIKTCQKQLWDDQRHVLDRNLFVCALEAAFKNYLEAVREESPDGGQELWKKARRKIRWLIKLSKDSG